MKQAIRHPRGLNNERTDFLYSIATFAIGNILAIFVGAVTNTIPLPTPRDPATVIAATPEAKNCGCYQKRTAQELKAFQQRQEALRQQRQAYTNATELLKQHGFKKGLRLLKESHPEIAYHLESFTETYAVAPEH